MSGTRQVVQGKINTVGVVHRVAHQGTVPVEGHPREGVNGRKEVEWVGS